MVNSVKDMRMLLVTLTAMALGIGVVVNAFAKKGQFYPTMIYLTKSSRTMSIMYILAFLISWQLVKFIKFIFFGALRAIEVEHLIERSWFAVIDTFILLAAFHEELSPFFVAMVSVLFVLKSFHWLINDRIDHMEQSPVITLKFHIRSVVLLSALCAIDVMFVQRAWYNVKEKGMSVDIAYGLEYAIMLIEALNTFIRYILHSIDLRNENPWENKPIYIRYVNIVLGVFELVFYAGYMAFMLMIPFVPLHIARRVYRAARDFQRSIYEVVTSHQAIRNLNTLYPDATAEELQTANNVCIICREEMVEQCKKLPCKHIFHTNCLRSWFQRQHTCPTCRLDVLHAHRRTARQQQPPAPAPGGPAPIPQPQPPHAQPNLMFPPMMGGWPPPPPVAPPIVPPAAQPGAPPTEQQPHPPDQPATPNGRTDEPPNEATPTNVPPPPADTGNVPFSQPFGASPLLLNPPLGGLPFSPLGLGLEPPQGLFSTLSDDQLHQLEGMERASVEARITLLRNIQTLLDTAVLQMNQYTNIMSSLQYPPGPGYHGYGVPNQEATLTNNNPIEVGTNNNPIEVGTSKTSVSGSSQGNRLLDTTQTVESVGFEVKDLINTNTEEADSNGDGEEVKSKLSSNNNGEPSVLEDVSEQDLIRQRRLQRFYSVPVTSATSDKFPSLNEAEEDNDEKNTSS